MQETPWYCLHGIRGRGGVTLVQALQRNVGNCSCDDKRETQRDRLPKGESSDAQNRGGVARSSDEAPVMGVERRGLANQLSSEKQPQGMNSPKGAKPYEITKQEVYNAWKRVKANKGAPGVDEESIAKFETKHSKNLYKLWNRMSSGSYFPQAVRRVEIPKGDGTMRPLGIPTVYDRIGQEVVRARLESKIDPIFHEDSYGYRPGKSAIDALRTSRRRNWKSDWVLDVDIRKFFDTVDHEKLLKAVRKHCQEKWMVLYIERWLKSPVQHADGRKEASTKGTPQGGVISPLLANLYLHYAFDTWIARKYPSVKFERYADDMVIHCRSESESEVIKEALARRLADCGLQLHPEKTKIVYCKDSTRKEEFPRVSYKFLGYTFRPRAAQRQDTKKVFTSFLPAASPEAQMSLKQKLREKQLRKYTRCTIEEVAEILNPTLQGWFSYFRHFCPSALRRVYHHIDCRLTLWARDKYRWHYKKSVKWLKRLKYQQPTLFAHWKLLSL